MLKETIAKLKNREDLEKTVDDLCDIVDVLTQEEADLIISTVLPLAVSTRDHHYFDLLSELALEDLGTKTNWMPLAKLIPEYDNDLLEHTLICIEFSGNIPSYKTLIYPLLKHKDFMIRQMAIVLVQKV